MTKIYVGGLPYQTDDSQLAQIFTEYGEVSSSKIIIDRETGRSKGFGFVEMANSDAAKKAIAELHEAELEGRSLTVNEARPQAPRSNGGYSGGGGGGYRGGGGGGGYRGGNGGGSRGGRY